MGRTELRALMVGDRVKHSSLAGASYGTVKAKRYGIVQIDWDERGGRWHLNPRSRFDRERARYLSKMPKPADVLRPVQPEQYPSALGS